MKRFAGIIVMQWLLSVCLVASEIKIGLFYNTKIESFVFSTVDGEYMLYGNRKKIAAIRKGSIFHIETNGLVFEVHDSLQSYGTFQELTFEGLSDDNIFQVKPVFPSANPKESEGNLRAVLFEGSIHLINSLELEKYLPGTIEAESGSGALPEYYKAQAVISRTYARKNFNRHAHEGFNLCDGTHCQVFNGKSRMNSEIYNATRITEGEILTDKSGEPIITAFHSCCGGVTANSAEVWNKNLYYLSSVNDPFCDHAPGRNWTKTVSISEWNAYTTQKGIAGKTPIKTGMAGRVTYLDEAKKLKMTEIRTALNLKSAYFTIEKSSDGLILKGHGFGHGLGLCQQGAMEMAQVGYNYIDILMFYFSDL